MIQSAHDKVTQAIIENRRVRKVGPELHRAARKKTDILEAATTLEDLAAVPGNRLEPLKGKRKGQHSIRINDQFRICFTWTPNGPADVEVTDYQDE
jgi:proteic killer suppression protein